MLFMNLQSQSRKVAPKCVQRIFPQGGGVTKILQKDISQIQLIFFSDKLSNKQGCGMFFFNPPPLCLPLLATDGGTLKKIVSLN